MQTRLLLIGLDAMEWDLVRRWTAEGKMPAFKRIIDEGSSGELSTTASQLPDTVWASIYTGTNPAKYEKYFYIQYNPETDDLKAVPDDNIRRPPFWVQLAEAGKKVIVADAPKFPLSRHPNIVQVTNWGAHATKTARASNPPELLAEIDRRFGPHPVADCDKVDDNPRSLRGLRQRVIDGVRAHGDLFRWLISEREWDVFFGGFSAPHCIGHHFWHYMDEMHPRHLPGDPHKLGDTIEQVYRALDTEIAKLIEAAGPDVQCLIFAGHGMGAIYHASWNLPEILDLLGYGKLQRRGTGAAEARKARVNPWRVLKMVLPGKLQYFIKAMLPGPLQDELLFRWYAGSRDWKGWKAIAVPNNDSVGAIRLKVRGRDKDGTVEPGSEYRQVCSEIAGAISELVDPESGRKVARRVTILQDEFRGPYQSQLPDITVLWDQRFAWDSIRSDRLGTLRIRRQDGRSGSHTPHGFLLAAGRGVQPGEVAGMNSIYDIAATVLHLAGVPIPADYDGKPLAVVSSSRAIPLR